MSAITADVLPGTESLCKRHDLMIELYRVDQAHQRAQQRQEAERLAQLEQYRRKIHEALARLPA